MKKQTDRALPSWFSAPEPSDIAQDSLFKRPTLEALFELHVSADECARWHSKGWLSWELTKLKEVALYDDPHIWEVIVVRDVVRSGLSDVQIDALLERLPRPLALDPARLTFSFRYGWVVPTPMDPVEIDELDDAEGIDDPDDVIEKHLDDWLGYLPESRLLALRDQINDLLGETSDSDDGDGQ